MFDYEMNIWVGYGRLKFATRRNTIGLSGISSLLEVLINC